MASKLCPQCKSRAVAEGHYVCQPCERIMAGSTPSVNNSSQSKQQTNTKPKSAQKSNGRPAWLLPVLGTGAAIIIVGVIVALTTSHTEVIKPVLKPAVSMTTPLSGTYTWHAPKVSQNDTSNVFITYIFRAKGTVINRRPRRADELCTYTSDGHTISIHHTFGMNETALLSPDRSSFQYDHPALTFTRQPD